jgi:activator of HSP90 ATPase
MKTFKKIYRINAEPEDIYAAITNPYTIELWTGYKAIMSEEPGSEFSIWEGDITGKNIEFVKNHKVVQEWYFGDQKEKSMVTITIKPEKGNSVISLEHTNIPDDEYDSFTEGWDDFYFGAIKRFFNPNF